jgi:predicted metal-binding protein
MNTSPLLYVCVTCARYATSAADRRRGRDLADATANYARERGVAQPIRCVECLMGCPTPCNATLRTPGKATLRFSGLDIDDVPALFEIATRYAENQDGDISLDQLPARLRHKLAARVMPIKPQMESAKGSVR